MGRKMPPPTYHVCIIAWVQQKCFDDCLTCMAVMAWLHVAVAGQELTKDRVQQWYLKWLFHFNG